MTCQNRWSESEAQAAIKSYAAQGVSEDLALRTYTARLLGSDPQLVLHGGGNTSVKTNCIGLFGDQIPVLCVKGSGWDLSTIEPAGHPAVRLEALQSLRDLSALSDEDMVAAQRSNLIDPSSPNPSVEALLHAFLPSKFVDHTHAVALLALADQPDAEHICRELYGRRVAIVPYVMPGFQLALAAIKAYEEAEVEAAKAGVELQGMVLLKHGLFSFAATAQQSYERMIKLVGEAEELLGQTPTLCLPPPSNPAPTKRIAAILLPLLRGALAQSAALHNAPQRWLMELRSTPLALQLVNDIHLQDWSRRGVATPDHVIRTKPWPLILEKPPHLEGDEAIESCQLLGEWLHAAEVALAEYIRSYQDYFERQNSRVGSHKQRLDPLPRLIAIPGLGLVGLGRSTAEANVTADIGEAWAATLMAAESVGRFEPVNEADTFEMEYWSLEQAKLGKGKEAALARHVVLVTGGGSGIGAAIALAFAKQGAQVVVLDRDGEAATTTAQECGSNALGVECDVTDAVQVHDAFATIAGCFGGLDIVVSNAGAAWSGNMASITESKLRASFELNLFAHQHVAQAAVGLFRAQDNHAKEANKSLGGQLLFNVSKQALNPGPGFGAYGIAKAALLALMKQYALEEGPSNIRCNAINADRIRSGLLDQSMIQERAAARGISEANYMGGNLLGAEVR
ncbi:MAG TPA: bifunctional aldolase/short-chain dehydrogenase, partial [Prochlorococcus sp.]